MKTPMIIDDETGGMRILITPTNLVGYLDTLLHIHLNPLEGTAIHVPTQQEYDTLMKIYEIGGWRWMAGNIPTQWNNWTLLRERTCIGAHNPFCHGNIEDYKEQNERIIKPEEFYSLSGISTLEAKAIAQIFDGAKILAEAP